MRKLHSSEISEDGEPASFGIFVTSKRLLKNAVAAKWFCADATYKVNWNGFPALVVGTTDRDRKFHLIGISVCSGETEKDFEFTFQSVKNSALAAHLINIQPQSLVCDAAPAHAIQNGFKTVFGAEMIILMCWAHMRKNVQKRIASSQMSKENQLEFLKDIDRLQVSY